MSPMSIVAYLRKMTCVTWATRLVRHTVDLQPLFCGLLSRTGATTLYISVNEAYESSGSFAENNVCDMATRLVRHTVDLLASFCRLVSRKNTNTLCTSASEAYENSGSFCEK